MGQKASTEGLPEHNRRYPHFKCFKEVAPGYYNCRAPFKLMKGMLNIGTHMSVCLLESGNCVAIDCVELWPEAKAEFDELTSNGTLLTAVLNTHPFHTIAIPKFHAMYPASESRRWFGCPRHLREKTKDSNDAPIEWHGDLEDKATRAVFEPEISMSIPCGAEFNNPKPPDRNHFSNVFVLHRASRTVHNDDCIIFLESLSAFGPASLLMRFGGMKSKTLHFHMSMFGPGLYPTEEAPHAFKRWMKALLEDWEFDNICTAHNGVCYGNARHLIAAELENVDEKLNQLSIQNAAKARGEDGEPIVHEGGLNPEDCGWSKDGECECG